MSDTTVFGTRAIPSDADQPSVTWMVDRGYQEFVFGRHTYTCPGTVPQVYVCRMPYTMAVYYTYYGVYGIRRRILCHTYTMPCTMLYAMPYVVGPTHRRYAQHLCAAPVQAMRLIQKLTHPCLHHLLKLRFR